MPNNKYAFKELTTGDVAKAVYPTTDVDLTPTDEPSDFAFIELNTGEVAQVIVFIDINGNPITF